MRFPAPAGTSARDDCPARGRGSRKRSRRSVQQRHSRQAQAAHPQLIADRLQRGFQVGVLEHRVAVALAHPRTGTVGR
ncbi:hypothetical protein FA452_31095, partial [Pseudomonas aeruginosa]|nr:hypothetical protein [Pseudomonas aeruginosa]